MELEVLDVTDMTEEQLLAALAEYQAMLAREAENEYLQS